MFLRPAGITLLARRVLLVCCVCAVFIRGTQQVCGQVSDYVVHKWTGADGLPKGDINGIARSRDGFLWIGASAGLIRFDGLQFSVFTPDKMHGLLSASTTEITAGTDSQLYIATGAGMTILSERGAKTIATTEANKPDTVQVVLPVGRDEAWFGTLAGYLYHYRNGTTEKLDRKSLSGEPVYGLAKAPDGTLWIGTAGGLFLFSDNHISRYRPRRALPISGFYDLAVAGSGSLFAATDRGVLQIDGERWRFWATKDGLPSDHILVLAAATGNSLWIGTTAGLAQLAQGKARTIKTPACSVTSLHVDSDKSLWVGCEHSAGLLHLEQPAAKLLSIPTKISPLRVSSVAEDSSGVVWMATLSGLVRWQNNQATLYTMKDGLPTDAVTVVSLAHDGSVWIGTDNGFARMHNGKMEAFRTKEPGRPDPIYSILEDHTGTLWVGTPTALLSRAAGQAKLQVRISASVWSLREDLGGKVWASTDRALFRLSGSSLTQLGVACGTAANHVRGTVEDGNGDIWAATADGLSRIRNSQCVMVALGTGTEAGNIDALASDLDGHLWLRVPDAVLAVNISEADRAIDSGGILEGVRFYGADDGFGDQLAHVPGMNAVIRHSSGNMWFAAASGVGVIDPSVLETVTLPLRPQVISLSSDTGDHDLASPAFVKPGDLRIDLAYTAPTMNGAESLEFRYKLTGFDKTWRPGGKQREAVYTSLSPGKYNFQVSARRPYGPWTDSSTPLEIRILPHYYQTWWWYALVAITLAAIIFEAYQFRLRDLRRQFATLMAERLRERSRLARELHDTLSQGMLGIHFQIEAAQVLLDVDPPSVRKHLENVGRLAREASIETRKSIAELRSDEGQDSSLSAMFIGAATQFSRSCMVDLATDISDDLPHFRPEILHEISRFLEEALANVRVHSNAQHAYLTAYNSQKHFVLTVKDDGKGFHLDTSNGTPGHFGLTGMSERAMRINSRFYIASEPGKGTTLTLKVPFRARWNRPVVLLYLSRIPFLSRHFRS